MENGSSQNNGALVGEALGEWQRTAGELQGLVSAYGEPSALQGKLRSAVIAVRKIRHDLRTNNGQADKLGWSALEKVSRVSEELSREIGRMKAG